MSENIDIFRVFLLDAAEIYNKPTRNDMSLFNPHPEDEKDIWTYKKYLTHSLWRFQNINKSKKAEFTNEYNRLALKFKVNRDQLSKYKENLFVTTSIDEHSRALLIGRGIQENIFSSATKRNPTEVELHPAWILLQSNSNKRIPLKSKNLEGRLPGLCDYLNYDVREYDYAEAKFKNKTINTLTLELNDGKEVRLTTRLLVDATEEFQATIDSYVEIYSERDESVLTKIDMFNKIEDYFNFIFSSQYMNKIFKINEWEKKSQKQVEVYMILPLKKLTNERRDGKFNNTLLFSKDDLPDTNSANALANWIKNYELFSDITEVIQLLKSNKLSEELRFTLLINALEATHRKNFNRLKQDKVTFKDQRRRILDKITNNDDKNLVSFHLNWANEIHLIDRLKDINDIAAYYGLVPLTNEELAKIKKTRDYLVHKDESIKSKAYSSGDLYYINITLANFLKVIVLNLLELTHEEILNIVESSKQINSFYRDEPVNEKANSMFL